MRSTGFRVRSRKGAPGVDEESIGKFEENLKDNLYKMWNRMSSGSYFPAPVRRVEIPKKSERCDSSGYSPTRRPGSHGPSTFRIPSGPRRGPP